jgi:hypothetical protein
MKDARAGINPAARRIGDDLSFCSSNSAFSRPGIGPIPEAILYAAHDEVIKLYHYKNSTF